MDAIARILDAGDHVVSSDDVYGGGRSSQYSFEAVATHEIGHQLGLELLDQLLRRCLTGAVAIESNEEVFSTTTSRNCVMLSIEPTVVSTDSVCDVNI